MMGCGLFGLATKTWKQEKWVGENLSTCFSLLLVRMSMLIGCGLFGLATKTWKQEKVVE